MIKPDEQVDHRVEYLPCGCYREIVLVSGELLHMHLRTCGSCMDDLGEWLQKQPTSRYLDSLLDKQSRFQPTEGDRGQGFIWPES